jgi:hypothetical protein
MKAKQLSRIIRGRRGDLKMCIYSSEVRLSINYILAEQLAAQ